ncbi:MAG: hypothetical protein Q8R37_01780 [Nanoarchaeota archaeon]|nr:hypothetical protein [Nanoarchaeota archaeon]
MKLKIIVWLLALLLIVNVVLALGIRPVKTMIISDDLKTETVEGKLWVVNTDRQEFTATVSVEGEMAEYVKLNTKELKFREDDDALAVDFSVTLPEEVPPGTSTADIIIQQTMDVPDGETVISSQIVLKHKIIIEGPYPDKYVVASLNFFENKDKIRLVSQVENRGKTDIGKIKTKFYVNDKQQKQQVVETAETDLKQKENKLLDVQIDKDLFERGEFEVSAVTTFDGQTTEVIKNLIVGRPDIDITYFDKFFIAHTINQYSLDLLNQWNKEIKNVFVDVEVTKNDQKIDEFRTKSVDIDGLMTERIRDYFDAKEKDPGKYTFDMKVSFWNSYDTETKTFSAELITEDEYQSLPTGAAITGSFGAVPTILLVVVMSVIASGSAFYFFWRRNTRNNKTEIRKGMHDNQELRLK